MLAIAAQFLVLAGRECEQSDDVGIVDAEAGTCIRLFRGKHQFGQPVDGGHDLRLPEFSLPWFLIEGLLAAQNEERIPRERIKRLMPSALHHGQTAEVAQRHFARSVLRTAQKTENPGSKEQGDSERNPAFHAVRRL